MQICKYAGASALMVAAAKGNLQVATQLVSHGADPAIRAADGSDAIAWALKFGHQEIAEFLQEHVAVRFPLSRQFHPQCILTLAFTC